MSKRCVLGIWTLALFTMVAEACLAAGGPVPGRWEKVERLPRDAEILVTLRWGEQQRGAYLRMDPEVLWMRTQDLREREILRKDVARVERAPKPGGTAWGRGMV